MDPRDGSGAKGAYLSLSPETYMVGENELYPASCALTPP